MPRVSGGQREELQGVRDALYPLDARAELQGKAMNVFDPGPAGDKVQGIMRVNEAA